MRQFLQDTSVALQGEHTRNVPQGAGRQRRRARGRPDRRRGGGRAQLRHGILQGLDLVLRKVDLLFGACRTHLGELGDVIELDPPEFESVARDGQLPLERGPRGGRRRAKASLEPGDVELVTLDGGRELGAPLGAGIAGRRRRAPAAILRENRRASTGHVECALEHAMRDLHLAAVDVGIEDASDRLHGGARIPIPGKRALQRHHHGFRRRCRAVPGRKRRVLRAPGFLGAEAWRSGQERARPGGPQRTPGGVHPSRVESARGPLESWQRSLCDTVSHRLGLCKATATAAAKTADCRDATLCRSLGH